MKALQDRLAVEPEVERKAPVSTCLKTTSSSRSQKSPSHITRQWSPLSPTPATTSNTNKNKRRPVGASSYGHVTRLWNHRIGPVCIRGESISRRKKSIEHSVLIEHTVCIVYSVPIEHTVSNEHSVHNEPIVSTEHTISNEHGACIGYCSTLGTCWMYKKNGVLRTVLTEGRHLLVAGQRRGERVRVQELARGQVLQP